jgi:ABC-2 type transport system ATP-binding protein
MRARLALAQALLPRPELLILDEPSDGLDPEGIHEMRLTILRLHRELNLTILLSSHFLNEVEQLCTRIAVLNEGRMVFEGTMSETKKRAQQVRLRVGDFEAACVHLRQLGLIVDSAEGKSVTLNPGVQTERLIRELVSLGMPVHELCCEQETLEQFYLALPMKPLCREGCLGLCPQCGADRNTTSCDCQPSWQDPRFAGLKRLVDQPPHDQ